MSHELPPPANETELDDLLVTPTEETVEAARRLNGDLLILGAGGKMGPSLAALAQRSVDAASAPFRVICVSRFGSSSAREWLEERGVSTVAADLLDRAALEALPDAPNVIYLAGMKFGSTERPSQTWAMNVFLPGLAGERYRTSRIVALSTGNVYPFMPVESGGATEDVPPEPIGEYAYSCLGRERMFEHISDKYGTPVLLVRLNYANDLRYGVLLDVAQRVHARRPIDLTMGYFNTVWQGDANAVILRAFDLCASPPAVLNLTGPEAISVRWLAQEFARRFGLPEPAFIGVESDKALLNNASRCWERFGSPKVLLDTMIQWTAEWVRAGGTTLGKPTHYEVRDGKF
jgi:nucleoside-diphosphate-sugar epimerase